MRCRALFASLSLTAATVAHAQSNADKVAELDAYVAKAVKDWQAPGLAISVVKDGKLVFEKGYGVREISKPAAFYTSTVSAIA